MKSKEERNSDFSSESSDESNENTKSYQDEDGFTFFKKEND